MNGGQFTDYSTFAAQASMSRQAPQTSQYGCSLPPIPPRVYACAPALFTRMNGEHKAILNQAYGSSFSMDN